MSKIKNRLKLYFIQLGFGGLFLFILHRLLGYIGPHFVAQSSWINDNSFGYSSLTMIYLFIDIVQFASMILWGLFFIGFALRVVEMLEQHNSQT